MLTNKSFKPALLVLLVLLLILSFSSMASAGGWWQASNSGPTTDTVGTSYWRDFAENSGRMSPHGGYVTASNLCKTCHAVHGAGDSSYRLLKNGTGSETRTQGELIGENGLGDSRTTECMYCHDADAGFTTKKPYVLGAIAPATVLGEHTLGATVIPDSNKTLPDRNPVAAGGRGAELDCYQCHSVHGANTIGFDGNNDAILDPISLNGNVYNSNDDVESWNTKILRVDPSGDNVPLGEGTGGITTAELATRPSAVKTGFCGDCHNDNPNWVTTTDTVGPNKTSHIQGPGADGLMEVYGNLDVAVAAHKSESQGCRGCHAASDNINGIVGSSNFPHQSIGWKLMWDSYTDTSTVVSAGDPNRSLPNMDRVCLMCHPVDNEFETGKGYADVATEQNLCFRCHKLNSFAGAPDVQTEIGKTYAHPTNSVSGKHGSDTNETPTQLGYNGNAPNNRHAECLDCHNTDKVVQGQGQALRGIWGVSVANGAAGTAPAYTKTTAVAAEYELCFKCHSSYVAQRTDTTFSGSIIYAAVGGADLGQGNKALEFNPNNNAFHPVEGSGRNQSANLNAQLLAAGLTTNSTIKCTDCHNSDITSNASGSASNSPSKPKGAHGSNNRPLLRANYLLDIAGATSYDSNNFKLCYLCHEESKLMYFDTVGDQQARTNFYRNSIYTENLHEWHLAEATDGLGIGVSCRNCHYNVHSSQQAPNTQYAWYNGSIWQQSDTPPAGAGSPKTHLISFSPDLIAIPGTGGTRYPGQPPRTKPEWKINLSTGIRTCNVSCHGGLMFNRSYEQPIGDDPSLAF